jgi:endo-1,4-beta-xylanase
VVPLIIESLNDIAKVGGLEFGASIGYPINDPNQTTYQDLVKRHCGTVTIDNDMKIGRIRPTATTVTYAAADQQVEWADKNGKRVRGHCLVWNSAVPGWIVALTNDQRKDMMYKHIDETMAHFTSVHEWDVVNEPIEPANKLPNNLRGGPWYDAYGGEAYIIDAFKRARANRPGDRLVLNEQGLEKPGYTSPIARKSFVDLVDRMLGAGIDFEIGIEGHIESQSAVSIEGMRWLVQELEDRKLYFRITELDDWDYVFFNDTTITVDWQDRKVSDQVRDLLFAVILSPYCRGVTTWQLIDSHSAYIKNSAKSRPLPFDGACQPKMAALAIRDAFLLRNAAVNPTDAAKSQKLVSALP